MTAAFRPAQILSPTPKWSKSSPKTTKNYKPFLFIQAAALAITGSLLLSDLPLIGIAAAAGLAGSLVDSLLGATVQGIYWCDGCQKETERRVHTCGEATKPLRGWRWLNNDLVNFVSSVAGGLLAAVLGLVFLL